MTTFQSGGFASFGFSGATINPVSPCSAGSSSLADALTPALPDCVEQPLANREASKPGTVEAQSPKPSLDSLRNCSLSVTHSPFLTHWFAYSVRIAGLTVKAPRSTAGWLLFALSFFVLRASRINRWDTSLFFPLLSNYYEG